MYIYNLKTTFVDKQNFKLLLQTQIYNRGILHNFDKHGAAAPFFYFFPYFVC